MSLVTPSVDIPALKSHIDAKRFSIAILAWVVYEMLITIGDSINIFWMHDRWTVAKAFFFINRVAVVFTTTMITALNLVSFESNYACVVVTWAQFIGTLFIISIVAFTLASRIYALWKGSRIVLGIFFLVTFANFANYSGIYGSALYMGTPVLSQLPFTGCCIILHTHIMWVVFATTLTFEALSIGLIIYKAWPIARQRDIKTPLFSLLLEDGLAYYLSFTISKLLVVGAIYVPTVVSLVILSSYPAAPVAALAINRLFIRLQRAMVSKPAMTNFTDADFSVGKPGTSSSGGGSAPNEIITIGESDRNGRIPSRKHRYSHDELVLDGDVELHSVEVQMASTGHGTSPISMPTAKSSAIPRSSKLRDVV